MLVTTWHPRAPPPLQSLLLLLLRLKMLVWWILVTTSCCPLSRWRTVQANQGRLKCLYAPAGFCNRHAGIMVLCRAEKVGNRATREVAKALCFQQPWAAANAQRPAGLLCSTCATAEQFEVVYCMLSCMLQVASAMPLNADRIGNNEANLLAPFVRKCLMTRTLLRPFL